MPLFESIAERIGAEFWVIGAGSPGESTKSVKYHSWSQEEESALLNSLDVGIMPLTEDPWSRGKCGYKLLQYMAVGKAVIASPVGVNQDIVTHGETGYLVREAGDWDPYLTMLSSDRQLSRAMGEKGLEKVTSFYSSATTGLAIVDYFNQVLGPEAS
jgi:glycosyltransferase involved in cell wall biosynthesis